MKRLFLIALALIGLGSQVQAVSYSGFDANDLLPLIDRAEKECANRSTRFAGVSPKILFKANKEGMKNICAELKQAYKTDKKSNNASWYNKKQLYKAFKKGVYKFWKKTELFPDVKTVVLNLS